MALRQKYFDKSFQMRREYCISAIANSLQLVEGEKIVVVEGKPICLEAWRIIHARGKTQFYDLKRLVMAGIRDSTHGNLGKKRMSEGVSQALSSMQHIIDESADHHPAKQRTAADNSRKVLKELPTSYTWEAVKNKVNQINTELGIPKIS